jgi:hypothetical protein
VAIWYILWPFGIFSVLVFCTKQNLATLPILTSDVEGQAKKTDIL